MRTFLLLLVSLLLMGRASAQQSIGVTLDVSVDPRIELLSAALSQSEWPQARSGFFSSYARDVQQAFFNHRTDPFIQHLNRLKGRLSFVELLGWSLKFSNPPELQSSTSPSAVFVLSVGGPVEAETFAKELRQFAQQSHFTDFFEKHRTFYDELAGSYRDYLGGEKAITRFADYYGLKSASIKRLLAPQFRLPAVPLAGEEDASLLLVSPRGYDGGVLRFEADRSDAPAGQAVFLELGEGQWKSALDGLATRRDRHADWYGYLREKMQPLGIADWPSMLAHSAALATAIRAVGNASVADSAVRLSAEKGYALLPYLVERLKEYEANREKYPTAQSFAPRLLDALDELEPVYSGSGEPLDMGLADVWLTEDGIPIKQVVPGSLAAKGGIKKGDTIQSIAGIRVNGSESYLKAWHRWEASKHNEAVPVKVLRSGKTLTLTVVMKRNVIFQGFRKKPTRPGT